MHYEDFLPEGENVIKVGLYVGYLSANNTGSTKAYLINLAIQLIKYEDIQLYLIYEKLGDHPIYNEADGMKLTRLPILNLVELNKQQLDVIHFNSPPTGPKLLPIFFFMKNLRKIATVHGDIIFANPSLYDYRKSYIATYRRIMQPIVSKWLDMLLPNSHNLANRLTKSLKVSEKKLHPIHHGIDHNIFKPIPDSKARIAQKYGLTRNFILHLSNYSLRKNPLGLLSTFEQLVEEDIDVDLVIIGKRWEENIHEFLNKINLRTSQRIKLLGSIPLEDLPLFYSAAELFFFPSYHENFGLPNIEAMACGTPVVTSKVYSIPEVTGDAAILCDPNDISDFVNAIKKIFETKKLRVEMINKGLENAKRFTWEKCAKETVKIYKEVINNQ